MKYIGNVADSLKIQFRIDPRRRTEQIPRHQKIGCIIVRDALWRHFALRRGFLNAADERLTFVVGPMTNFMS